MWALWFSIFFHIGIQYYLNTTDHWVLKEKSHFCLSYFTAMAKPLCCFLPVWQQSGELSVVEMELLKLYMSGYNDTESFPSTTNDMQQE